MPSLVEPLPRTRPPRQDTSTTSASMASPRAGDASPRELDARVEGAVEQELWRVIHSKRQLYGEAVSDLRGFFRAIDRDDSGRISRDELRQALARRGLTGGQGLAAALEVAVKLARALRTERKTWAECL